MVENGESSITATSTAATDANSGDAVMDAVPTKESKHVQESSDDEVFDDDYDVAMKDGSSGIGSGSDEKKSEAPPTDEKKIDDDDENKGDDNDDVDVVEQEEEDEESKQKREAEEKAKVEAEIKRIAELKKKYADWPLRNIKEPHENDVMYGRGGGTNHHPGNKRYRKMVEDRKLEYVNCKRLDKPLVALDIIRTWRGQLPPGRFLKIDDKTGMWHDVGDKKAREKTSQALREKAPMIRKQQEEEDQHEGNEISEKDDKMTRFADGTKGEGSGNVKKAVLARDHSLGREYLSTGEAVSLDGFTWQDPFNKGKAKETSLGGVIPALAAGSGMYTMPAGRNSSSGSLGMAPPYHHSSIGGPPPPPPPDYYGRVASGDQRREYSNGSLGSWGGYHFPPPPPGSHGMHQRSGSWTHPMHPPSPHLGIPHQRSGSWGSGLPPGREHSLSYNPLHGANVGRPADRAAFEGGRAGSGYWGEHVAPRPPPPPPPPSYYGGIPYMSSGSMGYGAPPPPGPPPHAGYHHQPNRSPPHGSSPSPPYDVDMNIARTWSGGEVRTTSWTTDPAGATMAPSSPYDGQQRPVLGANSSSQSAVPPGGPIGASAGGGGTVPRPTMVKRDTSNQNESYETKPMIKKAALNRDQSATSNRLKKEYFGAEYFTREMQTLQETTEQIRLSPSGVGGAPKPQAITTQNRLSTVEIITRDLLAKPGPLLGENRVSTIDALDLDLDGSDSFIRTDDLNDVVNNGDDNNGSSLPKPSTLGMQNRLTTQEFMEIVSAPLVSMSDRPSNGNDDEPLPLHT